MTTEINNLTSQGFTNRPGLRASPIPTESPDTDKQNEITSKTENVLRINFSSRQSIATEQASNNKPETNVQRESNSRTELNQVVDDVNQSVQSISRKLEFRIDDNSGRTVITVRDSDTQEVIRQIPSEQFLEVAARIEEVKQDRNADTSFESLGILFTTRT